jgi:hypothetical protein
MLDGPGVKAGNEMDIVVAIEYEPGDGGDEKLYDEGHLEKLRAVRGYIRSSGYGLKGTRMESAREAEVRVVPRFAAVQDVESPPDNIDFDGPDDSRPLFRTAYKINT